MFTGLVECTAKVLAVHPKQNKTVEIEVARPPLFQDVLKGHSVANNGVCLTITNENPSEASSLFFDIGEESLKVTTLSQIAVGDVLNLERPMKLETRLHGHIVTGHIDEKAKVQSIQVTEDGCWFVSISELTKPEFFWKKGSIVIDGVSLTVNSATEDGLEVCLIPETLEKTNLSRLQIGSEVNIEYDFLAKSVIHASKFK